jgi:hypothetical protein
MHKLPSYSELRLAFQAGSLTWQQVFGYLNHPSFPVPWQTREWKERRLQVLGKFCAVCGDSSGILTIYHLRLPRSFYELCEDAMLKYLPDYFANNAIDFMPLVAAYEAGLKDRDSCPKCGSVNVRFYPTLNVWKCHGRLRRRVCGNNGFQPKIIKYSPVTFEQLKNRAAYDLLAKFRREYRNVYSHEALAMSFLEHDRYMEMRPEDVVTLCKSCAFKKRLPLIQTKVSRSPFLGRAV